MLIGWDIGGVNTKVAFVASAQILGVHEEPFELQHAPNNLSDLLRRLAARAPVAPRMTHAVTMTAELSQMFRTKREGVAFVLDAVERAFPGMPIHVFTVDGEFLSPRDAKRQPLRVAAANWMATAMVVAGEHRDAVLIDTGTTTTDIIPIVAGRVAARGTTDFERLTSGELVYTGAVRTPVEAIVRAVTVRGAHVAVAAEAFALAGDVYLWRGDLAPSEYDAPTPDRRPAERELSGERLRRAVCADREMLEDEEVSAIADSIADAQVDQIAGALRSVLMRHPGVATAVVTGRGAFLAAAAAGRAGLEVAPLSSRLGADGARSAPAVAVALLGEQAGLDVASGDVSSIPSELPDHARGNTRIHIVVKIGGGTLESPAHLDAVLATLDRATSVPMLVVPGGGPFADVVREIDRRVGLPDETAHWMAIRAMDVFAELLASKLTRGRLVTSPGDVEGVLREGLIPVLAPFRWLREADPLPHSWEVTSDSIAAWLATVISAGHLLLVKPSGARGSGLADRHFSKILGAKVRAAVVAVDQAAQLEAVLGHTQRFTVASGEGPP